MKATFPIHIEDLDKMHQCDMLGIDHTKDCFYLSDITCDINSVIAYRLTKDKKDIVLYFNGLAFSTPYNPALIKILNDKFSTP